MPAAMPPRRGFDSTLAFRLAPYRFISRHCDRIGADVFQTRLVLRPTICMRGPDAARLFYDTDRFTRKDAAPLRIQRTLFGEGGVQDLDAERHRLRKAMLMSVMSPESIHRLVTLAHNTWLEQMRDLDALPPPLYDLTRTILSRAVCAWAGVPLPPRDIRLRTAQLTALYDGAGAIGPAHWAARAARRHTEQWLQPLIAEARAAAPAPQERTPLQVVALHHEQGRPLPARVAAVELLNLLRPTVAVAVYITHLAHALHTHVAWRDRLRGSSDDARLRHAFVLEVRRFYPFFPVAAARVRHDFDWRGLHFPAGRRVLLDLHGVNHDPRAWDTPQTFDPERFLEREPDAWTLVPQGGGDHFHHHRCAGEWITIALMEMALRLFTLGMSYEVPEQRLDIDERRLPALPASGMRLRAITVHDLAPPRASTSGCPRTIAANSPSASTNSS